MSFAIDTSDTTDIVSRFHRTLMDRRITPDFSEVDASRYDEDLVEHARVQWAGRAVAEYLSTAQFAQLLHRLTVVGAPLEIIGAATRLATDECRHAELCARMADALGGREDFPVEDGLSIFEDEEDPWLAIYRSILTVCCFGETLSIPMLQAITVVSTDPVAEATARIIAADEEYHANFGWEVMEWLTPRLTEAQHAFIQERLPVLFAHFESVCGANREVLSNMAGVQIDISERDPETQPNLGTLSMEEYAAIFYHTIEHEIFPRLTALGYDPFSAWASRPVFAEEEE